jgi:hypothetical protein
VENKPTTACLGKVLKKYGGPTTVFCNFDQS